MIQMQPLVLLRYSKTHVRNMICSQKFRKIRRKLELLKEISKLLIRHLRVSSWFSSPVWRGERDMQLQDQNMVTLESVTSLLRATSKAKRPWQEKGISGIPEQVCMAEIGPDYWAFDTSIYMFRDTYAISFDWNHIFRCFFGKVHVFFLSFH